MPGDHRARRHRRATAGGRLTASRAGSVGLTSGEVQRAYRHSTRVLGGLLFLLGAAIVVVTVARGGGPLALGVVMGLGLAVFGGGRLLLAGGPSGRNRSP